MKIQKALGFTKNEREQVLEYAKRFMNTEVVEEVKTKITLQHFKITDVPLKTLIQRMYFLTHSMLCDMQSAKKKEEYESIIERDKIVGKFYINIIMHLRSFLVGYQLTKEHAFIDILDLRLLIQRIELIGDEIREIAKEAIHKKRYDRQEIEALTTLYEQAFTAYMKQDVLCSRSFWTTEKELKRRFAKNQHLLRIYENIKDITDLVI